MLLALKSVLALSLLLALSGCSGSADEPTVEVDVSVDVCVEDDCFTAPVPGASVVVSGGGSDQRATTGNDGHVTVEVGGSGDYTVQAEWKSMNGEMEQVSIGNGSASGVSIRLLPSVHAS